MAGGDRFTKQEDDIFAECHAKYAGGKGWVREASERTGRARSSISHYWQTRTAQARHANEADADRPEFASPLTTSPQSVDDIVRLFKIDLTVWEPYNVTPNVWQMGAKHPETGELLKQNLYQTKVRFRRLAPPAVHLLRDALLADIRAETKRRGAAGARATGKAKAEPHALEIDLFDIHINKLSWAPETRENYDSDIAEERARHATIDLLAMAGPHSIEQIILPIGNDLTNADTPTGTTTAGTAQDTDTRYHRMFRRARSLTSWMIAECAKIAPVQVVVVPGNHDTVTTWTIGQVLEAEYAHDSRVTFQSGPNPRKYVRYGANLIGFTHGHNEPHGSLPGIMSVEQPVEWGQTLYREFHVGHRHTQKATWPIAIEDKIGATVRIIRALTAVDKWHHDKGYVGGVQGAEAFIWRKAGGLRAHLYHDARLAAVEDRVPNRKRA